MTCSMRALLGINGINVRLLLGFRNIHTMEAISLGLDRGLTLLNGDIISAVNVLDKGGILKQETGSKMPNYSWVPGRKIGK